MIQYRSYDKNNQKMSKSKGNVINPLDVADIYGTDAVRRALQAGAAPEQIRQTWIKSRRAFAPSRAASLLYPPGK